MSILFQIWLLYLGAEFVWKSGSAIKRDLNVSSDWAVGVHSDSIFLRGRFGLLVKKWLRWYQLVKLTLLATMSTCTRCMDVLSWYVCQSRKQVNHSGHGRHRCSWDTISSSWLVVDQAGGRSDRVSISFVFTFKSPFTWYDVTFLWPSAHCPYCFSEMVSHQRLLLTIPRNSLWTSLLSNVVQLILTLATPSPACHGKWRWRVASNKSSKAYPERWCWPAP